MTTPLLEPSAVPAATSASVSNGRAATATALSSLSTLAYFLCSDGIHNYLVLIGKACAVLARRLT